MIFKGSFPPKSFYDSVYECMILKHSLEGKKMCGFGGDPADGSKTASFSSSVLHFWAKITLRCQLGLVSLRAMYFPSIFNNKAIILL